MGQPRNFPTTDSRNDSKIPQTSDKFYDIPWCRALLTAPNTTVFLPPSRDPAVPKTEFTQDLFFAQTLAHPSGIPACICFHEALEAGSSTTSESDPLVREVSTLFSLSAGLAGYPGVLQGGVTGVLMDEILGLLLQRNMGLGHDHGVFQAGPATATLEVRFARPIPTPGVVRGRGTIVRIEGRKIYLGAEVTDGEGVVLASCTSVWVARGGARGKARL